jgi:hypothetical protein
LDFFHRLPANQQNRANGLLGRYSDAGKNPEVWNSCISERRNDADVGCARLQFLGAFRRNGVGDFESLPRFPVLEVPHERSSVEIRNGGNAHKKTCFELWASGFSIPVIAEQIAERAWTSLLRILTPM